MAWPVFPHGFLGAQGGSDSDTYQIERSLRFNSADSAYWSRTPSSAGNRKTWTWSGWVKRGKLGTTQSLFARYTANTGSGLLTLIFWNDDTLRLASGATDYRISTAKYRDCSAWYHVVCSVDTTQATANNRVRLYVNGSEITSFTTTNNYNQNDDTQINENVAHYIGYYLASVEFDGYLAEIHFIDGQALTPSSFGETDVITGRWKAKAFTGTYGTNGFYLPFSDNSSTTALGYDKSQQKYGTSNICTGGTASADSSSGSSLAQEAFDNEFRTTVTSDKWVRGSTGNGGYLRYQLPSSKVAAAYRIWGFLDSSLSQEAPNSWVFQGSNNGTNWTTLDTQSSVSWATSLGVKTYDITNSTSYLYYQIASLTTSNASYSVTVYELQIYEAGTNGFNHWTPNNFSVTAGTGNDSLVDSPTNYGSDTGLGGEVRGNYCTLSPLSSTSIPPLSNGNLDVGSVDSKYCVGTLGVSSGKWYWEVVVNNSSSVVPYIGVTAVQFPTSTLQANTTTSYFGSDVYKNYTSSSLTNTSSYTSGTYGFALDLDLGELKIYKNGGLERTDSTIPNTGVTIFPLYWTTIGSWHTCSFNFGQRPFAYAAPTGFKALCTQNLTQPTIQKPSKAMDVVTYTGNGTSPRTISGFGFSPDFLWVKNRTDAYNHIVYDTVRGAGSDKGLSANTTKEENNTDNTNYGYVSAFTSDGFSVTTGAIDFGLANTNSKNYVAWSWDAGSTNSTNTSGSITSTVRTNPQAGFSIVSYTGNGTDGATVGHGLGTSPKMVIVKSRASSTNWNVWHSSLSNSTYNLALNSTSSESLFGSGYVGTPSSTAFALKNGGSAITNVNGNTTTYIAYCFSEIEGYSKFGSYTGNGSTDGPFVWCGFRPRWILIKGSSVVSNWVIYDTQRNTFNATNNNLYPALSAAEDTSAADIDITSNGFKLREGSGLNPNTSGDTYIFAAFAEAPFKYARAR